MFKIKSQEELPLKKRIQELEELLKLKNDFKFLLDESIPKEANERKRYMGDIALFYGSIFKKKLEHFIGTQMLELSQLGRSEKMNDVIRANINCFRLIDEWMDEKTKEHFGDLEEMRKAFNNQEDFINEIKQNYEI